MPVWQGSTAVGEGPWLESDVAVLRCVNGVWCVTGESGTGGPSPRMVNMAGGVQVTAAGRRGVLQADGPGAGGVGVRRGGGGGVEVRPGGGGGVGLRRGGWNEHTAVFCSVSHAAEQ